MAPAEGNTDTHTSTGVSPIQLSAFSFIISRNARLLDSLTAVTAHIICIMLFICHWLVICRGTAEKKSTNAEDILQCCDHVNVLLAEGVAEASGRWMSGEWGIVIRRNNVAAAARSADHHCQHIYTRMNGWRRSWALQFYIDTVMEDA